MAEGEKNLLRDDAIFDSILRKESLEDGGSRDFHKKGEGERAFEDLWNSVLDLFADPRSALRDKIDDGRDSYNPHAKWLHDLFFERLLNLMPNTGTSVGEAGVDSRVEHQFDSPQKARAAAGQVAPSSVMETTEDGSEIPLSDVQASGIGTRTDVPSSTRLSAPWPEVQASRADTRTFGIDTSAAETVHAPLEGGRADVALRAIAQLRQLADRPKELEAFLIQALAPALTRLEREGGATPEELVDILLLPLAGKKYPGTRLAGWEGVAALVAGLRSFLEKQHEGEREDGYYKTRGALAQWLQKIDEFESGGLNNKKRIVFYYHELLSLGLNTEMSYTTFSNSANNLGGALASLWRDRAEGARGMLLSRIQALATAVRLDGMKGQADRVGKAGDLFAALGMPTERKGIRSEGSGRAFDLARAIMIVANIPSAWRVVDPIVLGGQLEGNGDAIENKEDWMALMSLAAGVVRMAYNGREDWDEIPASLFNAGVALGRQRRAGSRGDMQNIVAAQVSINATGLAWALVRGKDWEQTLDDFHGIDCAVNFFGALTEWTPENVLDGAKDAMRRLAGGLLAAGQHLSQQRQAEYVRLNGSWKQLGIGGIAPTSRTPKRVLEDLGSVLGALSIPLSDTKGLASNNAEDNHRWIIETAKALSERLKSAVGEDHYGKLAEGLGNLLESLLQLSENLDGAWKTLYGDIAEYPIDKSGTVETEPVKGRKNSGPLVWLGEMSRADWIAEADTAVIDWPQDKTFGDWLKDFLGENSSD